MPLDELHTYNEKLPRSDKNLKGKELLKCVFKEGRILNKQKNVEEITLYVENQIPKLDEELLNSSNREKYKIRLSKNLIKLR